MHIYNRLQKSNKLCVVELGAGCGLVGIACQILGAHFVLCTDGAAEVVDLTRNNISANCHLFENRRGIKACSYRWGEDGNSEINEIAEKVNLIVCSDCVLPKLFPIAPLVHALDKLMSRETECYLSYEDRYFEEYHPREKFIVLAEMKGLMVEVLPMSELDEVYSVEDIEIW